MADGFDHIIDTSGKQSLAQNAHLLTNKGQITLITTPPDTLQDVKTFYMKSQRLVCHQPCQSRTTKKGRRYSQRRFF